MRLSLKLTRAESEISPLRLSPPLHDMSAAPTSASDSEARHGASFGTRCIVTTGFTIQESESMHSLIP